MIVSLNDRNLTFMSFHYHTAMIIGFSERRSTVSEGNAEEHFRVPIGMATLRTAEREHPMIIRLQVSSSTAIVEPYALKS